MNMNNNNIMKMKKRVQNMKGQFIMTVIYYIGTKDKDTKNYKFTDVYIKLLIINEFSEKYPNGFTITEGTGYYKHDNGEVVTEKTYIATVLGELFVNADLTDALKDKLNQECIAVQVINDNVVFK